MASDEEESASAQPITVSAAMALAKGALEGVVVRLVGEVSQISNKAGYKAVYFTVKDAKAALPCMMWVNRYRAAGVSLAVGQLVELTGRFSLYAAKGRMNFDVFSVSLAGEGDLRLKVANIARKLQAEGLTDASVKRPVPAFPLTIGVVTSPRGAAVHDVLRTLRRRFPVARVLLAGVPVEGANAPAGIVEGMRCVYHAGAEVVLVVRGGGSFEDLMPFNDENLARWIRRCPVPVVTGIGHEPDTSIADMVADVRASTPTAAAEAVNPSRESLEQAFESRSRSLTGSVERVLERSWAQLDRCASRPVFRDPNVLFAAEAQGLDIAADRLSRALPAVLASDRAAVCRLKERLSSALPSALGTDRLHLSALEGRFLRSLPLAVSRESVALRRDRERLLSCGASLTRAFSEQVGVAAAQLHALSPLAVIGRGYAIARSLEGGVVRSVDQAPSGSRLDVTVSDGVLACRVEEARRVDIDVVPMHE